MTQLGYCSLMTKGLFFLLRNLNLPQKDFAVFGSGPLIVRGIIPCTNDLDVICRGNAWDVVNRLGEREYLEEYDATIVSIADGAITFGISWGIGQFDIDSLIDTAEIIEDLPFVQLPHVIAYKRIRRLAKDLEHIEAAARAGVESH